MSTLLSIARPHPDPTIFTDCKQAEEKYANTVIDSFHTLHIV